MTHEAFVLSGKIIDEKKLLNGFRKGSENPFCVESGFSEFCVFPCALLIFCAACG
jgi:hypothetical protein